MIKTCADSPIKEQGWHVVGEKKRLKRREKVKARKSADKLLKDDEMSTSADSSSTDLNDSGTSSSDFLKLQISGSSSTELQFEAVNQKDIVIMLPGSDPTDLKRETGLNCTDVPQEGFLGSPANLNLDTTAAPPSPKPMEVIVLPENSCSEGPTPKTEKDRNLQPKSSIKIKSKITSSTEKLAEDFKTTQKIEMKQGITLISEDSEEFWVPVELYRRKRGLKGKVLREINSSQSISKAETEEANKFGIFGKKNISEEERVVNNQAINVKTTDKLLNKKTPRRRKRNNKKERGVNIKSVNEPDFDRIDAENFQNPCDIPIICSLFVVLALIFVTGFFFMDFCKLRELLEGDYSTDVKC